MKISLSLPSVAEIPIVFVVSDLADKMKKKKKLDETRLVRERVDTSVRSPLVSRGISRNEIRRDRFAHRKTEYYTAASRAGQPSSRPYDDIAVRARPEKPAVATSFGDRKPTGVGHP